MVMEKLVRLEVYQWPLHLHQFPRTCQLNKKSKCTKTKPIWIKSWRKELKESNLRCPSLTISSMTLPSLLIMSWSTSLETLICCKETSSMSTLRSRMHHQASLRIRSIKHVSKKRNKNSWTKTRMIKRWPIKTTIKEAITTMRKKMMKKTNENRTLKIRLNFNFIILFL